MIFAFGLLAAALWLRVRDAAAFRELVRISRDLNTEWRHHEP